MLGYETAPPVDPVEKRFILIKLCSDRNGSVQKWQFENPYPISTKQTNRELMISKQTYQTHAEKGKIGKQKQNKRHAARRMEGPTGEGIKIWVGAEE